MKKETGFKIYGDEIEITTTTGVNIQRDGENDCAILFEDGTIIDYDNTSYEFECGTVDGERFDTVESFSNELFDEDEYFVDACDGTESIFVKEGEVREFCERILETDFEKTFGNLAEKCWVFVSEYDDSFVWEHFDEKKTLDRIFEELDEEQILAQIYGENISLEGEGVKQ